MRSKYRNPEEYEKEWAAFVQTIKNNLKGLPDLLSEHHLIYIGLYSCKNTAKSSRARGINHPPYIRKGKGGVYACEDRVFYPKDELIKFLETRNRRRKIPK